MVDVLHNSKKEQWQEPHYIRDLCLRQSSALSEDDSSDKSSENNSTKLPLFSAWLDYSSAKPEGTDSDDDDDDDAKNKRVQV